MGSRWASCQTRGQPNCAGTICSDGLCVLLQTTCIRAPCYPIPYCVPEAGGSYNLHKLTGKIVKQCKAIPVYVVKSCGEMVGLLLLFLTSVLDGMLQLASSVDRLNTGRKTHKYSLNWRLVGSQSRSLRSEERPY